MDARVGWLLALAALAVGWWSYRWQGVVLAVTVITFWLLLQFSRTVRLLRQAAQAPIGHVNSAVMLHSKLRAGMPLADVIRIAGSLGLKTGDAPEKFEWTDAGDVTLELELDTGRCSRWQLRRPGEGAPAAAVSPGGDAP